MKERIKTIIQTEGMTPSSFADAIHVSRASINHILNGRNNPSLEVVTKILTTFDNIHSDWLLYGKEPMFKVVRGIYQPDLFNQVVVKEEKAPEISEYPQENELKKPEIDPKNLIISDLVDKKVLSKKIDKIMIFYSDKTFDVLVPE